MYIGIDPGWASCGICFFNPEGEVSSSNSEPRSLGLTPFIFSKFDGITNVSSVVIERYVAYEGVHSPTSEDILMLIGALVFYFEQQRIPVFLVRAIDWKPRLCKHLVKTKGFKNPSTSFDKHFSLAAAESILGYKPGTDHEADAICLAYLGSLNVE